MAKPKKPPAAPRKREKTLVKDCVARILGTDGNGWRKQFKDIEKHSGHTDAVAWLDTHCAQVAWARKVLRSDLQDFVFVDTETTGVDEGASIVDIAIVRHNGSIVLNTFCRPDSPMTRKSIEITGITDEMLVDAPSFAEVLPQISSAFEGAKFLVAYNANFDRRVIEQSAFFAGHEIHLPPNLAPDIMDRFGAWTGDWDNWWTHYKWHKLEAGHRALGDAVAMVEMVKSMAASQAIENR